MAPDESAVPSNPKGQTQPQDVGNAGSDFVAPDESAVEPNTKVFTVQRKAKPNPV